VKALHAIRLHRSRGCTDVADDWYLSVTQTLRPAIMWLTPLTAGSITASEMRTYSQWHDFFLRLSPGSRSSQGQRFSLP